MSKRDRECDTMHAMISRSETACWNVAMETSGSHGSVAVGRGPELRAAQRLGAPRRHASDLLPTLDALLRSSGGEPNRIEHVFVSIGPGSFTGLRIGVTVARTLAFACGAKVFAIPTLTAIAQNALAHKPRPPSVAVILDARRENVYAARFVLVGDRYVAEFEPAEVAPRRFLSACDPNCAVLGEGVEAHRAAIEAARRIVLPNEHHAARAEVVYQLGIEQTAGAGVDPRTLTPLYIRPPEPEEKLARIMHRSM